MSGTRRLPAALLAPLGLLSACSATTPLAREVEVGRDAYAIFVGDGRGRGSDLFAVPGHGGRPIQLTYSPVEELAPALSPNGDAVAFVRQVPNGARRVWVLNLLSGSERELEPPDSASAPRRVGWKLDGTALYVETADGAVWRAAAPPASGSGERVSENDPAADSALAVLVGSPMFARVQTCAEDSNALCAVAAEGTSRLAGAARDPARWGPDSLAFLSGDRLFVRPLGPGRVRPVEMPDAPANPRHLTAFGGLR